MIVKGILDGISDGIKSALCFTDRAYIKINGKRIKRIYEKRRKMFNSIFALTLFVLATINFFKIFI